MLKCIYKRVLTIELNNDDTDSTKSHKIFSFDTALDDYSFYSFLLVLNFIISLLLQCNCGQLQNIFANLTLYRQKRATFTALELLYRRF